MLSPVRKGQPPPRGSGRIGGVRPDDLEDYARSAARAAGLEIDEAWWPTVVRHLGALMKRAESLERDEVPLPDEPAPEFRP
jgi:hypothetical protein